LRNGYESSVWIDCSSSTSRMRADLSTTVFSLLVRRRLVPRPSEIATASGLTCGSMLDPRIYRMGLLPVVLAVIVLAFSLGNQQGALGTNLAPDAYSGTHAYSQLRAIVKQYPGRWPGSAGDQALASYVASQLRGSDFSVSTDFFRGRTVDGARMLENVVGVRAGLAAGTIVLVADRSSLHSSAAAELSGTAVLLELARVV